MTRFLGWSILKMPVHVFVMHAECSLKTQLKRKPLPKLDFQIGKQLWKLAEGLINTRIQKFIFERWQIGGRGNIDRTVVKR